ncbi:hypothetical protein MNB_SV-9-7 [hydrothermal vent metagenome]|uniref:Uncharacterized protein n=1 Tax=hydrothermal vent metagenome TaxID=652676 RepID=A0A1W1BMZ2_9ZZZZ
MELNYNQDLLRSLLNAMGKHDIECSELKVNRVVIFNSKFYIKKPKVIQATDPKYKELSSGEFKIDAENAIIMKSFEKIKETIIQNKNN